MKKRFYFLAMLICLYMQVAYAQAPTITSFSPAKGAVGTLVTITGTNLNVPTTFTIGGVPAIVVSNTQTTLVGMVMPNASTGNISLRTATGTANSTSNFTVTPTLFPSVQQGNKLVGTGSIGDAQQGSAVAISADGNTAVIGGSGDNNGEGAAWIFVRNNAVWTQQGNKLVGTGNIGAAQQGSAVAISADGNTVAVAGSNDNNRFGAVWVFVRNNGVWMQQGDKLVGTGNTGANAPGLGVLSTMISMSADGNTIAVGGRNDNNIGGGATGATWVFVRSNGVWAQQGNKLVGTGGVGQQAQGRAVALSADGNTLLVTGTADNGGVGAAWLFTRTNGVWTQQGNKLVGSGAVGLAFQGQSASLSADGNTAIWGAFSDNNSVGAVWTFTRTNGIWAQEGNKLVGASSNAMAGFGYLASLSADGNTLLIGGASVEDNWLFTRNNGTWAQRDKLGNAGFNLSLSADGATAIVSTRTTNNNQGGALIFTNILASKAIEASSPSPVGFRANWNKAEGAVSYQIDVAIDANFSNMLSSYRNLSVADTSLLIRGLAGGITYYYRVRAVSANGIASESSNTVAIAIPQADGISVTTPRAGDYLQYRSFFTININSNLNGATKVELLGLEKPLLLAELPQGLKSFRWYVPASLPPRGNYKIVVSSLGSNKLQAESQAFSIGVEPPEIKITPNFPASIPYQSTSPLQVSVDAGSLIRTSEVVFYYKTFSSNEYKTVKVNALESNPARFTATIPYSEFDQLGMEYFFEFSKDGFVQVNSILGKTTIKYPNLEIPYSNFGKNIENYEILAIPLNLKDNLVVDVFKDELGEANIRQWRAFRYVNGSTASFEGAEVKAGEGFWLIAKDNPNKPIMTGEGTTIPTSTEPAVMHSIPIRRGWNQIGNPYLFPLDFANLVKANSRLGITSLFTFEKGEYKANTQLKPFQGGFVFASTDGNLRFPPAPYESNSNGRTEQEEEFSNSLASDTWQVRFNLLSSAAKDVIFSKDNIFTGTRQTNLGGFGMHPQASRSKDNFDVLTPPRFLEHLEINFLHPEYFYPYFSKDVVPTQESYVWEFSVESGTDGNYKTLSWEKIEAKEGKNLILFDIEKNIKIDMSKETAYTFDLGIGIRKFKVYFGNESFLKENLLPEIASAVAYPNPFSEDLKFNVSITEKSKAYLQLYNSVGQVVLSEEKTFEQAGFYVWDLLSSVGNGVPPTQTTAVAGIYVYQIQVESGGKVKQFGGKVMRE